MTTELRSVDELIREPGRCFATALMQAREMRKLSQESLGSEIAVTGAQIGKYESGANTPDDPVKIVKMASILGQDARAWMVLANLQRAASSKESEDRRAAEQVLKEMLPRQGGGTAQAVPEKRKACVTLEDFPHAFLPLAVVVGDKREEHPVNTGDLFAFSASTVDDRWIATLCLPSDTEKFSDKVFAHGVVAKEKESWLRDRFGKTHILSIGSPASNLFSRRYNRTFLFRFAISRQTEDEWRKITEGRFPSLHSRADLANFSEKSKHDLRQTMRMFKQPGFVNFVYRHLKLAIDPHHDQDFAVVSLGRNPFAAKGDRYFAILVAGIHHPGTAHALRFLADSKHFEHRPFGGILEIEVPDKGHPVPVEWYERIEKSKCDWHNALGDTLEYTPEGMRERLVKLRDQLGDIKDITDFVLDEQEIEDHLSLLDLLGYKS